jgi:hypothetical protein
MPICGAVVSLWIFTQGSRQELGSLGVALLVGIAFALASRRGARAA